MNNPYLDPKNPKNELLDTLLHDYFKKRGLSNTAEVFQSEARINGQTPPEFDKQPHGLLYDLWIKSIPQIPGPSGQSQAPNVGAIMDNTPQMIRDGYSIQHFISFTSSQKLLSCDFSSDGNILASCGKSGKPFICYIDTGDCVTTSKSHSSTILEVRFQPGSTIFATSSADKTVKLWDAKKAGSLVRFQPGSGKLLAVANQNVITILEYPSLVFKNSLQGLVKHICSLCWDVTGQTIASVSEDCVRVWSLSMDGKRFQSVIFHPRHRNVLVVSGFQCMELWTLGYGQIHHIRASSSSFTGLAACTGDEFIASTTTSNDSESMVNISK